MIYQRIRYFLMTCETGSIKKAAAKLFLSAPALTKQIRILEEELGSPLFKRTPQGVTLTWFGEFARSKFSALDQEFQTTLQQVQTKAKQQKPRVNIGIFAALPQDTLVSPFVSLILSGFPEYQINLIMVDLDKGKHMMLNRELDFLLTYTHEEDDWGNLSKLSFGSFPAKVIVSALHPWAAKDKITELDMHQETFLKMHVAGGYYKIADEDTFYYTVPCAKIQEASNFQTLLTLLYQGRGFAIFPESFAYSEYAKIKSFDCPGRQLIYHTVLIYNPQSKLPGISEIARHIADEYNLVEY